MSWTTTEDIHTRWIGDEEPTDDTKLQTLIDDAEDAIKKVYPGIQARIDADTLAVRTVKRVVVEMIQSYWKTSGSQFTSQSQTMGPYSKSVSMPASVSRTLRLTQDQVAALAPAQSVGAWTIDTGLAQYNTPGWVL